MLVHAESDSLLQDGLARMAAAGRRDPLAHHEARPPFVEEEAVHRALFLAAHAGVRIQIVHVSSPVSADLVRREKAEGRPATMEVCPHHLLLDLDDLVRLGPYGVCAPALRDRALVERLWDAVLDGTADCLISDHSAYTLAEKEPGWTDIFDALLGCQVIQETVPLVLDEAYHRRGMALDAFVRFSSTNAARIAGLYPRKGSLLPGADADVVLYDLESEWVVDAKSQQFSKNPWSPFDGRRVRARVVRTLVRGETVFADGEIVAEPGSGAFLSCHETTRSARTSSRRRAESGRMFRLALINPNTDARHTDAMGEVARETLPDGCEVTAVSPDAGADVDRERGGLGDRRGRGGGARSRAPGAGRLPRRVLRRSGRRRRTRADGGAGRRDRGGGVPARLPRSPGGSPSSRRCAAASRSWRTPSSATACAAGAWLSSPLGSRSPTRVGTTPTQRPPLSRSAGGSLRGAARRRSSWPAGVWRMWPRPSGVRWASPYATASRSAR